VRPYRQSDSRRARTPITELVRLPVSGRVVGLDAKALRHALQQRAAAPRNRPRGPIPAVEDPTADVQPIRRVDDLEVSATRAAIRDAELDLRENRADDGEDTDCQTHEPKRAPQH
jgi:hypothetical protein